MKLRTVILVAACSTAFASTLLAREADGVRVSFANGRVTVIAENATVSEILREWARVGGSSFVNAEKISPAERVTLRLENEPEIRAIDVLLRSVTGYVVAPQPAGSTALSSVGRVLIMPARRPLTYPAPATRAVRVLPDDSPAAVSRMPSGLLRPDDDGPVRQEIPPVLSAERGPMSQQTPGHQAGPLQNTTSHTSPGLGIVTSPQPGVVIGGETPRPGGRPVPPPPKPKPGGGGG